LGHGGARPGAGRRKGVKDTRVRISALKALREGDLAPIDVLLSTMRAYWDRALYQVNDDGSLKRDEKGKPLARVYLDSSYADKACEVAQVAAPFCHPKLSTHVIKNPAGAGGVGGMGGLHLHLYLPNSGRVVSEVPAGAARQLVERAAVDASSPA